MLSQWKRSQIIVMVVFCCILVFAQTQSSQSSNFLEEFEQIKKKDNASNLYGGFENRREELLFWATKQGNQKILSTHLAEVAACVLVKDEHLDFLEWMAYHRYLGVGKFYIYDNMSRPPMIFMLQQMVARGLVDYQFLDDTFQADDYFVSKKLNLYQDFDSSFDSSFLSNSVQVWALTTCVRTYGRRHKWMVLVDADEFLVIPNKTPQAAKNYLPQLLKNYDEYGAVAMYRRDYGSSNHTFRPKNGVLDGYTQCTENISSDWRQFFPKIIVNTKFLKPDGECRVHECYTTRNITNTIFQPQLKRWFNNTELATWEILYVNHYALKSIFDFRLRQHRGLPHLRSSVWRLNFRKDSHFVSINNNATSTCTQMQEYTQYCCQQAIQTSNKIYESLIQKKQFVYYEILNTIQSQLQSGQDLIDMNISQWVRKSE